MDLLFNFISMAGGLAMFLYGMNILGSRLEQVSGGKLERTLEKMTSNVFKGVLVGAVITAAIQSSSATTVIVVGLVNAGILKLRSAIGVIMGANIGTTVTGQILRLAELDSSGSASLALNFIKPTTLAPIISVVGILLLMASQKKKWKTIGEIMLGFGILFQGMFLMTDSVEPLSELPIFGQLFVTLGENPALGILAGTIVTAIIQSSSASVGILQALAATGQVTCAAAFPIIMGQNIGTCVTSLLSSIGANKNAKRAAMVHLYFNIMGTIIFVIGVYGLNAIFHFSFWESPISMGGIANFHTLFNIVVTIIFIPFTAFLEKLATITVRGKASDAGMEELEQDILDPRFIKSPSIALGQAENVVARMGDYSHKNFSSSYELFEKYSEKRANSIREIEDAIDKMEDRLNNYLLELTNAELTQEEGRKVTLYLKLDTEFERVGDYAINLVESAELLVDRNASLSPKAMEELKVLYEAVDEIIGMAIECVRNHNLQVASRIEPLEEVVDMMVDVLKSKHVERLKKGKCTIDGGFAFLEVLTFLERISDHCSNIAVSMIGYAHEDDTLNRHEYIRKVHDGHYEDYVAYMNHYKSKYLDLIHTAKKEKKSK
ncbi:MAG: Na/Pi cotransporter family protein [Massiliimalia sp.]|jgi:phosphate:Na+ symporter